MSSLLQFNGKIDNRGVHLQFTQCVKNLPFAVNQYQIGTQADTDGIYTPDGKWHARIWTACRKPRGMFGPWVVFQFNGKEQVPDLSCPIDVEKLPKDARPLPVAECLAVWAS